MNVALIALILGGLVLFAFASYIVGDLFDSLAAVFLFWLLIAALVAVVWGYGTLVAGAA